MYVHGMRSLFRFPGWVVKKITTDGDMTQVDLRVDGRCKFSCPQCGKKMSVNRRATQMVWDYPLGLATLVLIVYEAVQGRCRRCGKYHTFRPAGFDETARATMRFMMFVSQLCRFMPVSRIHDILPNVDSSKAWRWDKKVLERKLPEPDLDNLRVILVDEKSVRKRHGYVTLVMNGETGEILFMAEGKKKASLQKFFDQLTKPQRESIRAVGMDRSGAYLEAVRENLPNAEIVFDRFHIMQNLNDVIDQVRREEWRRAHEQDKAVIKGQRYNLFRNPENQTEKQKSDLKRLLAMNANLSTVYLIASALRRLWEYRQPASAAKYFDQWIRWAMESGVAALVRFAKNLASVREHVLSYFKYRITQGPLESFNNTVSRLIHRACGVSNLDYLFLKLRQESLA